MTGMNVTTTTVAVPLSGGREYDIHIGAGLLSEAGRILQKVARTIDSKDG